MESVEKHIITYLSKRGRGTVFFSDTFAGLGTANRIHKAMEILIKQQKIIRVARGIYCYPKIDKKLGLGVLFPSVDDIVKAIAKRDNARIVPTGVWAQNVLGLSTQVPLNYVYLTDGTSRKLEMFNGCMVTFKHTALKNLSFNNYLAMLINVALRDLGQQNVTEEHVKRIHQLLQNENRTDIERDYGRMTGWIREIVKGAYE